MTEVPFLIIGRSGALHAVFGSAEHLAMALKWPADDRDEELAEAESTSAARGLYTEFLQCIVSTGGPQKYSTPRLPGA